MSAARKAQLLIIMFVGLIASQFIGSLSSTRDDSGAKASFPKALQIIEEEAFSTTALETLIFEDDLRYIGDRAFQDIASLTAAYIPGSVSYIGEATFPVNEGFVISGIAGSLAQKWAETNHVTFQANDIWTAEQQQHGTLLSKLLLLWWIILPADRTAALRCFEKVRKFIKSMRPQDRPELNPIDYRFP